VTFRDKSTKFELIRVLIEVLVFWSELSGQAGRANVGFKWSN